MTAPSFGPSAPSVFMSLETFSLPGNRFLRKGYPGIFKVSPAPGSPSKERGEKCRSILCISDFAAKLCSANALPAMQGSLCGVWNPEMIWRQNFKNIRRTGAHAICDGPFSVALQRLWHIFLKTENTKGTNPFKGKETTKDEPEKIAKEPV